MSYQDPYTGQNAQYHHQDTGYQFNPYSDAQGYSQHQSIPHSPPSAGFPATPGHAPAQSLSGPFAPYHDEPNSTPYSSGYPQDTRHRRGQSMPQNDVYYASGDNSFKDIKDYRSHYQGNLWTKGSRIGCFGRFFCCTFFILIYLALAIIASLALWLRPPSVTIGDPGLSTTQNLGLTGGSLRFPLELNISVNNPTYISVKVEDLTVNLDYPIANSPDVGNGTVRNVNLRSGAETNFTLPIDLEVSIDQSGVNILSDISTKCGFDGGPKTGLKVNADIHIKLRAFSVPASFTVNRVLNFGCPAFAQDAIQTILQLLGGGN